MRPLKETFGPAAPYAMLPVRLFLFAALFPRGTQKLLGWFGGAGLEEPTAFLRDLGLPLPAVFAFCLAALQIAGSVAFLVGAGVRFFGLAIAATALADLLVDHLPRGWSALHGGMEFNAGIIAMCLALTFRGPGHASIEWADEEGAAPGTVS